MKVYAYLNYSGDTWARLNTVEPYLSGSGAPWAFVSLHVGTATVVCRGSLRGFEIPAWPYYTVLELKEGK